jgi:hypothetical protein
MVNLQFNMPMWGPGYFVDTHQSFVDFNLSPPLHPRPTGLDLQLALEAADVHLGKGEWERVLEMLAGHMDDGQARKMCARALEHLGDAAITMRVITNPRTAEEAVLLGDALLQQGAAEELDRYLADRFVSTSTDASVAEIVSRIRVRAAR